MPRPYFEKTSLDVRFYEEHLWPRLPPRIFDVHVHLNLPEHVAMVPEERWRSDWALESGHLLPVEDAYACARELFPEQMKAALDSCDRHRFTPARQALKLGKN